MRPFEPEKKTNEAKDDDEGNRFGSSLMFELESERLKIQEQISNGLRLTKRVMGPLEPGQSSPQRFPSTLQGVSQLKKKGDAFYLLPCYVQMSHSSVKVKPYFCFAFQRRRKGVHHHQVNPHEHKAMLHGGSLMCKIRIPSVVVWLSHTHSLSPSCLSQLLRDEMRCLS